MSAGFFISILGFLSGARSAIDNALLLYVISAAHVIKLKINVCLGSIVGLGLKENAKHYMIKT